MKGRAVKLADIVKSRENGVRTSGWSRGLLVKG